MKSILIKAGNIEVKALLSDNKTARAIWRLLPIKGIANTWGDEIYFSIDGGKIALEKDADEVVSIGDLAYWPPGQAFCIFFGPTPASCGNEIRAASAVNIFGKVTGNYKTLKDVKPGTKMRVEKSSV